MCNHTKKCTKCGEILGLNSFYKDKNTKDGLYPYCKACVKVLRSYQTSEQKNKWRKENPEKAKESHRKCKFKRQFGITLERYDELFAEQNGKCAICGTEQSALKNKLSVDHSHETNKVRGLLCNRCNFFLGHFRDNIEALKEAVLYLNRDIEDVLESLNSTLNPKKFVEERKCTHCGEKDVTKFGKTSCSRDGLCNLCKRCAAIKRRKYLERKRNGYTEDKVNITEKVRTCTKCGESNPENFYKRGNKPSLCKQCNRDHKNAWGRARQEGRKCTLKIKHGMTLEQYNELLVKQNSKCLICGIDVKNTKRGILTVDHCHKTGKTRGLLCHCCNAGLGNAGNGDDPEILQKAITYLSKI